MAVRPLSPFLHDVRRMVLLADGGGLTDGQLLECWLAHNEEAAFRAIVKRHGPMVLGVCRRVLRDDHDAEDAFQATFLVLMRKAATVQPRELVGNWLYSVAHRTALKARTRRWRAESRRAADVNRRMTDSQATLMSHATDSDAVPDDLLHLLDEELARLPEKYRAPIVLCDLEGKPRKQAAKQLGCPEGTVSSRLNRGREMLRNRLIRRGVTLSAGGLTATLTSQAMSAVVPPALVISTSKAATLVAAGTAVAAGLVSAKAVALTEGVLKAMLFTKLKVAAVIVAVGMVGTGTGVATYRTFAAEGGNGESPVLSEGRRLSELPPGNENVRPPVNPEMNQLWNAVKKLEAEFAILRKEVSESKRTPATDLEEEVAEEDSSKNLALLAADKRNKPSVKSLPPAVIETFPKSGDTQVDAETTKEIRVTFSKEMMDKSWSWSQISDDTMPNIDGVSYDNDRRVCTAKVKLEPGKTYVLWLNSQKFGNFKDADGRSAVPYLLVFETKAKNR